MLQGSPSQWSTTAGGVVVQPKATTPFLEGRVAVLPGCQHIAPRLLAVRVRVVDATEPSQDVSSLPGLSTVADALVVRWGVGLATFSAELDVIAGGQAFAVYADWVTLYYQNDGSTAKVVSGAVVEGQVTETLRVPRRTRRGKLGPAPATLAISVPDGASRVQFLHAAQLPTQPIVDAADSKGSAVGTFIARPFEWLYLPGGCATLTLSQNPVGADLTISALFEVPL